VHAKVGRAFPVEVKRENLSIVEGGPEAEPSEELSCTGNVWELRVICHGRILA
jgi:hypothetical protein